MYCTQCLFAAWTNSHSVVGRGCRGDKEDHRHLTKRPVNQRNWRARSKEQQTRVFALHHFQSVLLFTMTTMLLVCILVGLVQAQIPPRVQRSLLSLDLGFTPVDYNGNHPYERRRKAQGEQPPIIAMEYPDRVSYGSLRIKFVADPMKGSATYDPLFEDTLQEVSLQYIKQC
jgi:hypothetical protein